MNHSSVRPSAGGDFDLKSSVSARARDSADAAEWQENDDLPQDDYQIQETHESEAADDETADIAPDLSDLDAPEADSMEILADSLAPPEVAPANYLGLNEESEIEEIEGEEDVEEGENENGEKQFEPMVSSAKPDAKYEDYAEFERIFIQWKATNDPRLRERLILMNRSMVMFLARRFMDRGELFEDVMQVGMLGLIYALDGYDLNRGVKFSTFAIPTISGEIRRYFRDKVSGMRVPRGLQELHAQLQARIEELTQQLDRSPTYAEIAFSLKIEVEQVVEALELGAAIDPLSIDDRYFGEESATIAESIGAPDPHLHAYEEHAALQAALEKLPQQERRVLELSFFEGHSQSEIARRMNVSQMHISRLLRRSLAQLKQLLEDS